MSRVLWHLNIILNKSLDATICVLIVKQMFTPFHRVAELLQLYFEAQPGKT
jgi:hypothetical protein